MAVPVVESTSSAVSSTSNGSISLSMPSGLTAGDLLVVLFSIETANVNDCPILTGFTRITHLNNSHDTQSAIYYRIVDGDETWPLVVTSDNAADFAVGWALRISGVDTANPINQIGDWVGVGSTGSSLAITGVTTDVNDCLALFLASTDGADITPGSVSGTGWSLDGSQETPTNNAAGVGADYGTKSVATAGATGTVTLSYGGSDGCVGVQIAISPDSGSSSIRVQSEIEAGADDLLRCGSYFSNAGSDVWLGYYSALGGIEEMWLRFDGVTIPQGVTIDEARLVFEIDEFTVSSDLIVRIWAEDVDDSTSPTTEAQFTGKTKTTAYADWTIEDLGQVQHDILESADIKSVIQEIVDRGGWARDQAIGLILTPTTYVDGEEVGSYSFDDSTYQAPILVVHYSSSSGQSITPSLVSQSVAGVAPTITTAVSMSPSLASQLVAGVAPTITTLASMTPAAKDQPMAAVDPTISVGAVSVSPSLVSQLLAAIDPALATGAVSIAPSLVSSEIAGVSPVVADDGSVTIGPDLVSQPIAAVDPALIVSQLLAPDLASQLIAAVDPELAGTQPIAPSLVDLTATATDPSVAGTQIVSPDLIERLLSPFDPVVSSIVTMTPALVSQPASAIDPTVEPPVANITVDQVWLLVEALLPAVLGGSISGDTVGALYRLVDDRLTLVWDRHRGMGTAFQSSEGWELVSQMFVFPAGSVNDVMDLVRNVWLANKTESQATLEAALNDVLTAAGYRTPWDTAPNASHQRVT